MTEAAKQKEFKPVTFWLADPQNGVRLMVPGQRGVWIRFEGGKYTARSQEEVDLIKREIGYKAWEEDLTKAPAPHPLTGYAPMASGARDAHVDLVTVDRG